MGKDKHPGAKDLGPAQPPRASCCKMDCLVMLSLFCGLRERPGLGLPVCGGVCIVCGSHICQSKSQTVIPFCFLRKGDLQREALPYTPDNFPETTVLL